MTDQGAFLTGVRVLDLTTFLSGPHATQILSDLGADVVKVESRAADSSRSIPPYFVDGDSVYFHSTNRTKRSIQLDLKTEAGRRTFQALAASVDVVIDNFRPGVMERLGADHESLRSQNARMITCSISGFGDGNQWSDRPAYDAIVQALSGGMSLTGHKGGPPARMGIPIGDLGAGVYAALAISAALYRRDRHGVGEHIEISMLDCQVALLSYQAAYYLHSGVEPGRQGSGHVSIPTYRSFECADGEYIIVTANTDDMWRSLCRAIGREDLVEDPRFATSAQRLMNRESLSVELESAFSRLTMKQALELTIGEGVPAAPVNTVGAALSQDVVRSREMVVTLKGSDGHSVSVPGNPIKTAGDGVRPSEAMRFPPRAGQDTDAVLAELLGLSQDEIAALRAEGAAGPFI